MSIQKIELTEDDYNKLVDSSAKVFNSTMLSIFSERSKKVFSSNLIKNYQKKSNIYEPSKIDPRIYNEISNIFFDSVDKDFECIELSPINPFGLNSSLTYTNQNNVLSCIRNSEVISDSSLVMALECANRIKNSKENNINLASSTRLLRMQNYGNGKKAHWSQHFRACSLVSSFRNNDINMFLTLKLQIYNWLNTINNLKKNLEIEKINVNLCYLPLIKEIYKLHDIELKTILMNTVNPDYDIFAQYKIELPRAISFNDDIKNLKATKDYLLTMQKTFDIFKKNIIMPLNEKSSDVEFHLQLNRKSGLTYYDSICYDIEVVFKNGKTLVLVDGGVTDWIGKILSDSKEKCVTSGMGLEYLGKVYKRNL